MFCRNEAMTDLIAILNTLLDKDGKILIPGIMDDVEPLTPEEKALYKTIDFDVEKYRQEMNASHLLHHEKVRILNPATDDS